MPTQGYRFDVDVYDRAHIPDESCPWAGLEPIDERHSEYFYGRDEEIQSLIALLHQRRLVVVIGGSGLGKSSLIRAGLCQLWKGRLMNSIVVGIVEFSSQRHHL